MAGDDVKKLVVEEVVPVALPPKPPPSVDELVARVVSALPKLGQGPAREALQKVMTLVGAYVGGPDIPVQPIDKETAILELGLTQNWSEKDIAVACETVMNTLAKVIEDLQEEFERETGTSVEGVATAEGVDFKVFADRYLAEREEQAGVIKMANGLLETVRNVSGQGGISNPDPGIQSAATDEENRRSWLSRAGIAAMGAGRRMATVAISPFIALPGTEDQAKEAKPIASWQTPPVLVKDDRDLQLLELVQKRLVAQADVSLVLATLEKIKLGRSEITDLLRRVATKARRQLEQSKEILTQVAADNQRFASVIGAVRDLQRVVLGVDNFFFPEGTKV